MEDSKEVKTYVLEQIYDTLFDNQYADSDELVRTAEDAWMNYPNGLAGRNDGIWLKFDRGGRKWTVHLDVIEIFSEPIG